MEAALAIALGLAVLFAVVGFGYGAGWGRPLFFFAFGLAASLAIAHQRRRCPTVLLTPAAVTVCSDGVVAVSASLEGVLIAVSDHGGEVLDRYFADHHGDVFVLPATCSTAAEFVARYPTRADRAPFAVRREGPR
jgi:hypothetical protein